MSVLTKESIAESEIILNKTNIALARSRALIKSWMKNPASEEDGLDDADDDFQQPESETAGIGSTVGQDDSLATLTRNRQASSDKLLEQILGKRAAQAHRKTKAANKAQQRVPDLNSTGTMQSRSTAQRAIDEAVDEEEGRAATLGSFKANARTEGASQSNGLHNNAKTESDVTIHAEVTKVRPIAKYKRKTTSFMDELLSKKARKKSRQAG